MGVDRRVFVLLRFERLERLERLELMPLRMFHADGKHSLQVMP